MRALAAFVWICICILEARGSSPQVSFETAHGDQIFFGEAFKGGLKQSHETSGNLIVPTKKGCSGSTVPPNTATNKSNGLIFLVERGDCLFFDKVASAETHGADAIIVYNDAHHSDDGLFSLSCGKSDKLNIPAVMISHANGKRLLQELQSGKSLVNLSAFSSPQCTACEGDADTMSIYCAFGLWRLNSYMWEIFVAFVFFMIVALLVMRWTRRRLARLLRHGQTPADTTATLSKKEVSEMETVKWSADEELGEQASCCICLENFEEGQSLVVMPCSGRHTFHPECIKNWLLNHSTKCPLCKFDVANASLPRANEPAVEESKDEDEGEAPLMPAPNEEEGNDVPLLSDSP